MKITSKKIFVAILAILLILSSVIPAFAAENEDTLPHIERWINGKASGPDGAFLYDVWAVDDTGISEFKYVLVNQEGTEALRIEKYPEDVTNGEEKTLKAYDVELTLKYPEDVDSEIILTLENKNALYYIYFNEQNNYTSTTPILPGEYKVTYVDVVTDTNNTYRLKNNIPIEVKDMPIKTTLEIERLIYDFKKVEKESEKTSEVAEVIKSFDTNGDLLGDTISLFVFFVVVFGVYLYIKRKREKAEEINKQTGSR